MALLVSRKPWDCRLPGSGVKTHCLLRTQSWTEKRKTGEHFLETKCWLLLKFRAPAIIFKDLHFFKSIFPFPCTALYLSGCSAFRNFLWSALKWYLQLWTGVGFPLHRKPWLRGREIWKWFHLVQPRMCASQKEYLWNIKFVLMWIGKGGEKWGIVTQEQQAAHLAPTLAVQCTLATTYFCTTRCAMFTISSLHSYLAENEWSGRSYI